MKSHAKSTKGYEIWELLFYFVLFLIIRSIVLLFDFQDY